MALVTIGRVFGAQPATRLVAGLSAVCILCAVATADLAHAQGKQAPKSFDFPFSSLFRGPGLTTHTEPPADWVRKSRPAESQLYSRAKPVPAVQPDRAPITPEQLRTVEEELNALRNRHDRAGKRPRALPGRTAAAPPAKPKTPGKLPCVLTCNVGLGSITR